MKKALATLLIASMAIASLAACGGAAPSDTGATQTVTDCAGRTVEIPEDPQRVACMYASNAHMMVLLDEGDSIVGAPKGVKTDQLMLMKYPEIALLILHLRYKSSSVMRWMDLTKNVFFLRVQTY